VAIEDRQDGDAGRPDAVPSAAAATMSARGAMRRRFAKAGIGATGVVLILASQPGMAADICTSPSGSLSGGLKSHHGPAPVCAGLSPGYWKNHTSWPGGISNTTKFGSIYPCNRRYARTYGVTTCITMLDHQSFDESNLAMHLVAAYLNVLSGRVSFQTIESLRAIWNEWQTKGYYTPSAGVQWNSAQIVVYLSGTMA
jgi:hypothetical protein